MRFTKISQTRTVDKKYITKSNKETQKLGQETTKIILKLPAKSVAVILGLYGDLGAGKTTFLQGFAKGLGIKEKILSPTFVVMKRFGHFYHFDCYRLKDEKDILELFPAQGGPASGWKEIISNPKNIVAIEWPERIKKALPKNIIKINFKALDENKREISFKI